MAYATGAQLLTCYDARLVGDLVSDNDTRDASPAGSAVVAAILEQATSKIRAAITVGNRYTVAQVDELVSNGDALLVRMTCDFAIEYLFARRGMGIPAEHQSIIDASNEVLLALSSGKAVLDIDEARAAGLIHTASMPDYERSAQDSMANAPLFPRQRTKTTP